MVIAVNAGILSGFSGLESIPGPQLPEIDFLRKWNGSALPWNEQKFPFSSRYLINNYIYLLFEDENQKKYAEFDKRFKSSTVLKELLEKSKLNKER